MLVQRYIDPKVTWFSSYKQTIKKILDFQKIRDKLKSKNYQNAHEFSSDVRIIWNNAMKFNHPHEPIWKMAWNFISNCFDNFQAIFHIGS
jgi:hypothetical protein